MVAEGAAESCADRSLKAVGTDASGNPKLFDIGTYLRDEITNYCKKINFQVTLKYIDPTYMIRSCKAHTTDRIMCANLGIAAVHGAFAGYTNFTVGIVAGEACYIPVKILNHKGSRKVDIDGAMY